MHLGRGTRVLLLLAIALLGAPAARAGHLNGVHSSNGVDVVAVGDSGMIFRSVDGGALMSKSYQGSTPLRSVAQRGLTIVIVGDGGKVLRTTDSGLNWSSQTLPGSPNLLRVVMPTDTRAYAGGAGGGLYRSTDGGQTWTPLVPGTSATIRGIKFVDADNGWIVGDGGFIASTSNGGDNWSPGGVPTTNALYDVDQLGTRVWAVGAGGTCWKSTNSGGNWTPLNLRIDSRSDVNAVTLQSADTVFIAGGGGFIRRSVDDGATWTFLKHEFTADVADMHFVGQRGWIASTRSPAVLRTANAGESWALPAGAGVSRSWVQKQALQAGTVRGSTIALHPLYRNTIYCAIGSRFYVSRNDGETWTQFSQLPPGFTKVNAFLVSPKDSMNMVITASPPNAQLYSLDGGANWQLAATRVFGEYGIPIEMHPDKPDTLLFGGDNSVLYRSIDFGKSWQVFGSKSFRSPCDLIIVPEADSNEVLVGDGITGTGNGEVWRSVDGGETFTKHLQALGSEVPGLSMGRLDNQRAFATNWSQGGVHRTNDRGLDWDQVAVTTSAWGTDVCDEDPNVVIFGVYSGSLSHLSFDGGDSFITTTLPGSNYSFYARDRGCILAEQGGGLYKLTTTYNFNGNTAQNIQLLAGNGGEVWDAGSTHDITWNATGIIMARIEYQLSPEDPWELIGEVPGNDGRIAWNLPSASTLTARVRVRDAFDGNPSVTSFSDITIAQPLIASLPTGLDFGLRLQGTDPVDSVLVTNDGTGTLHVTSVTTGTADFEASPTSFDLTAGNSAWVYVTFHAAAVQTYNDVLTIVSDAGNDASLEIPLAGEGVAAPILSLASPDGGEIFQYGTTQKIAWSAVGVANVDLEYRIAEFQPWVPIATSVPGAGGTYEWLIPDDPTAYARLRVKETGGALEDVSSTLFQITVPRFQSYPYDIRDIGPVLMGGARMDTIRIRNTGSAPLTISNISIDRPTFVLGRTSMTVPPGVVDTLGVTYTPESTDRDTATLTFVADDPAAPHQVKVTGFGTDVTGVGDGALMAFVLGQNLPNPFRGSTRITYSLPRASDVSLDVFNLLGQRVATLVDGPQSAGTHHVNFVARRPDGSTLPSGVYFYRFRAGGFAATRKMLLMR